MLVRNDRRDEIHLVRGTAHYGSSGVSTGYGRSNDLIFTVIYKFCAPDQRRKLW